MKPAHELIRSRITELRSLLPTASAAYLLFCLETSAPVSHAVRMHERDGELCAAAAEAWHRATPEIRSEHSDKPGRFIDAHVAAAKAAAATPAANPQKRAKPAKDSQ